MHALLPALLIATPSPSVPTTAIDTRNLVCAARGAADQVAVEIANGAGRIRMPAPMVPRINAGQNGWFVLKNVKTTHDDITAFVELNPAMSANVNLHRITGELILTGNSGAYSGECRPSTPR